MLKLFGKKNNHIEEHDEIIESEGFNADEENEEELIAVISAAVSVFLKEPVSGFKVVSFKKRGSWSNI